MREAGKVLAYTSLALGLVVSTAITSRTLLQIKHQGITVTGSAKKRIVSDMIRWEAVVKARAEEIADAYSRLNQQAPQVLQYLESKGVPKQQIVSSSIHMNELHPRAEDGSEIETTVSAYEMTQIFTVQSNEVEKIVQVSRESTELINRGILLQSRDPEFHYTKLADIKIGILAEAGRDAKSRAQQIAASTGADLGKLRFARMGVTQVNPAESTQTSAEGNNDLTSREKDVIAVVTANFAAN